ncbi:FapA family protein [Desulforegula conservatrix]|uniref:FapA family protein n=1 Tax=Desulforegula conservatrix TaxID=153026 RepID=UPI00040E295B|nr:FapA family protein [Desulforegula conservatrix]
MPETQDIIIQCELCKSRYRAPASISGKVVKCPKCSHKQAASKESGKTGLPIILTIGYLYGIIDKNTVQLIANLYNEALKNGKKNNIESFIREQGLLTSEQLQLIEDSEKAWDLRQMEVEFAQLLIKNNLIAKDVVDKILKYQVNIFNQKREIVLVGDILVAGGLLTKNKRDDLLASQGRKNSKYSFKDGKLIEEEIIQENPGQNQDQTDQSDLFEIKLSEDKISAYLILKNDKAPITVNDVLTELDRLGISYGVVDNSLIEGFLKYHKSTQKLFKLAQGIKTEPGRNAVINYYFDTEYLKPCSVVEGDQIDFRDRGTIPFVNAGDIVAEKVPAEPSNDGIDVLGQVIQVPRTIDVNMLAGNGIVMDESNLKAIAQISGQPVLSFGGIISILPEIEIKGDVGYQTGHIVFEGNIIIKGSIQDGFKVKGANITAAEIAGGIIEATGSVTVSGGVTDATISCMGILTAKFINSSNIHSYGDIFVKNEIIDSTIITSGAVEIKKGTIISSDISAKRGMIAREVGSETSRSCRIKIGTLDHEKQELRKIESRLEFKRTWAKKIEKLIYSIANELKKNQEEQTKLAHIEDRASIEIRSLKTALAEAGSDKTKENVIETRIKQLQDIIEKTESRIALLFRDQDLLEQHLNEEPHELEKTNKEIERILNEKHDFEAWMDSISPVSILKVEGAIAAGTVVSGEGSSAVVQNTVKKVRVQEVIVTIPPVGSQHEMVIKPLN